MNTTPNATTSNLTATQIREILSKDPSLDLAVRRSNTPDGSNHVTGFRWAAIGAWTYPEGEVTPNRDCGPGLYGYSVARTIGPCHGWRGEHWTLFGGEIAADLGDKVKYSRAIVLARGDARTIHQIVRDVYATGIVSLRIPVALTDAVKEQAERDLFASIRAIAHDGIGLAGIGAAVALVSAGRLGYRYHLPTAWTTEATARALVRHGWDPDDAAVMAQHGRVAIDQDLPAPPDEPGVGQVLGYWTRDALRELRAWDLPTDLAHARGYAMAGGRRDRIDHMARVWGVCPTIAAGRTYNVQTLPSGPDVRMVRTRARKPSLPWIYDPMDCHPTDRLVYHTETGAFLGRVSDADYMIRAKRGTMKPWTKADDKRLARIKAAQKAKAEKERARASKIGDKIRAKLDKVETAIAKVQREAAAKEDKIRAKLLPQGATVKVQNGRKSWGVVKERHVVVTLADGRTGRSTVPSYSWGGQGNPPIAHVSAALIDAQIQRVRS